MGIWYSSHDEFNPVGFTGAGPFGDERSSSGFVFNFGSGAVAWGSRQRGPGIVSTSEAEYDNADMTKNTLVHGRTEHIDRKLDFVRELVAGEFIAFTSCDAREQQADIFTKVVSRDRQAGFRIRLGVRSY